MKEETSLAIVFTVLILTIGGCIFGMGHDTELTMREKEKTKQMRIQASIDSLKIINNITQADDKKN